jgi:hypothetical protein
MFIGLPCCNARIVHTFSRIRGQLVQNCKLGARFLGLRARRTEDKVLQVQDLLTENNNNTLKNSRMSLIPQSLTSFSFEVSWMARDEGFAYDNTPLLA